MLLHAVGQHKPVGTTRTMNREKPFHAAMEDRPSFRPLTCELDWTGFGHRTFAEQSTDERLKSFDYPQLQKMKLGPMLTLCLCVLLVAVGNVDVTGCATPPVEWGVEVGDELTYLLQRKTIDSSLASEADNYAPFISMLEAGQKMIARVDWLGPIPPTTNQSWSIPLSNCTMIRENDSQVMMHDMNMIVIPLNVWHLNSSQFNMTSDDGSSLVNTTLQFGSVLDGQFWMGIILVGMHFEMIYSKSDGALDRMMMEVSAYWSKVVDVLITRWTPGTVTLYTSTETTDSSSSWLAPVGVTLGVITAIAAVTAVWLRRRRTG